MLGAVQVLSARLALLEPAHLDHIEGRLHAIHTRMNSISEKKAAIEDADKQSKVDHTVVYPCTQVSQHILQYADKTDPELQYFFVFMRFHEPNTIFFLDGMFSEFFTGLKIYIDL